VSPRPYPSRLPVLEDPGHCLVKTVTTAGTFPFGKRLVYIANALNKSDGPTAGTETMAPLEFLARVLVHIPDQGHVTTRYYGWYANRPRGMRAKAAPAAADGPPAIVPAPRLAPTEATRRWAALLQQLFEVDPLACPTCHGAMRIVAFITQASVIDQILAHLRTRPAHAPHAGARSPPSTRAPATRGASRAPRPSADAPPVT
jgi:hypothetical protein